MNSIKQKSLFIGIPLIIVIIAVVSIVMLMQQQQQKAVAPAPQKADISKSLIRPSLIATGFNKPTGLIAGPESMEDKLFVTELAGTIRTLSPKEDPIVTRPFLDISSKVLAGGEMGLLGLAFHPDFKKNGYFYVNYIDKDQNTTVARYSLASNGTRGDEESEKVVFWIHQPYANHNGGALAFGPDGYLYIAMGDGGSAGDPQDLAQDKTSYLGKILRIDVDKPDLNKGLLYSSPSSNPFVEDKTAKSEIWAYGLRNPWRMSFDMVTKDLFIADVGQGGMEEVNVQSSKSKGGENYGWRCKEGSQDFNVTNCKKTTEYVDPIIEYSHEKDRCSITGGYMYHGNKYTGLNDKYFYADYCTGELFYATKDDDEWESTLVTKTPYAISTFGQDNAGELYLADYATGSLYQIRDESN